MSEKVDFETKGKDKFNVVRFQLSDPLKPYDLGSICPPFPAGSKGVVLSGRGPIWLYSFLIHCYQPSRFIATYDPCLGGAVVVKAHTGKLQVGDIIRMDQ